VAVEYAVIIGTLAVAIIGAFAVLSGKLMVLIELLPL
jgi:Flp pilus assembly pilin Flp